MSLYQEVKSAKRINYYQTIMFAVVFSLCTFPFILLTASAFTKPKLVEAPSIGAGRVHGSGPNTFKFTVNGKSLSVTVEGSWVEMQCGEGLTCE